LELYKIKKLIQLAVLNRVMDYQRWASALAYPHGITVLYRPENG